MKYDYEVYESNAGFISLVIMENKKPVSITTEYEYDEKAGSLTRLFYQLDHEGWDSYIYLDETDAVKLVNEDSDIEVTADDLYKELEETNELIAWGSPYYHDHIDFDDMGFAGRKVLGITEYKNWWIHLFIQGGNDQYEAVPENKVWYEIDFEGEETYFESLTEAKRFIDKNGSY